MIGRAEKGADKAACIKTLFPAESESPVKSEGYGLFVYVCVKVVKGEGRKERERGKKKRVLFSSSCFCVAVGRVKAFRNPVA